MKKIKGTIPNRFLHLIFILLSFVLVFGLFSIIEIFLKIFYYPATYVDNLTTLNIYNSEQLQETNNFFYLESDKIKKHVLNKSKRNNIQLYRKKSAKEIRIITCGASSVVGCPFHQQGSFPHFLQVILKHQWPNLDINVYNMAIFAQTYQFVYETVDDTINHSLDFLIIYSGHNELYPHNLFQLVQRKNQTSRIAYDIHKKIKKRLVTYNIFYRLIKSNAKSLDYNQIQELIKKNNFQWNEHIDDCIENYKYLTDKIVNLSKKNNTSLIYLTPLSNIRDFPPNVDVNRLPLLRKNEVDNILKNNYLDADTAYRLGRYFDSLKDIKKAGEYYQYSSDNSVWVGRIHTSLLRYIREIPNLYSSVKMIDLYSSLRKELNVDFLDDSFFFDWCHLKPESNYLIAREIAKNINKQIESQYGPPENPIPDYNSLLEIAINSKKQFFDFGYQEAGFTNAQFHRWEKAIYYFNKVSYKYKEDSIKVTMGLFLANSKLNNEFKAEELLKYIKRKWSITEITPCIDTYYNFETNYINEMLDIEK